MSNLLVPQVWSDAYDGSPNFDGTATVLGLAPSTSIYTMTQNIIADTLTIRSGVRLITAQYAIWAREIFIESGGFLSYNGNNGSTAASDGTGSGAALTAGGHLGFSAAAGGTARWRNTVGSLNGNAGGSSTASVGVSGGAGGTTAGVAGAAGTLTALNVTQTRLFRTARYCELGWKMPPITNSSVWSAVNGSTGGGGGPVTLTTSTAGDVFVGGGGGGSGGGLIAIRCGILRNLGTIEAKGGSGGNGAIGTTVTNGGAGGGGGGGGGVIHIVCDSISSLGTISVAGGGGGNGAQIGTVYANRNGNAGSTGALFLFVRGEQA